jgi:hypothetical protein
MRLRLVGATLMDPFARLIYLATMTVVSHNLCAPAMALVQHNKAVDAQPRPTYCKTYISTFLILPTPSPLHDASADGYTPRHVSPL